jgi:hypothetical protein
MLLFTVQPRFVYDQLQRGEPFYAEPRKQSDHWLNEGGQSTLPAYDWLCEQMEQRGLTRPASDVYPVWAWFQWAGPARRCPDLRNSQLKAWAKTERQVLMTLEVPDNEVLLHDYEAWHFALNYWHLARPRAGANFERRCQALGLSPYRQKPLPDQALHAELVRSWQAILDLRAARAVLDTKVKDQIVQATFWRIEPPQLRRAVEFGLGKSLKVLHSGR